MVARPCGLGRQLASAPFSQSVDVQRRRAPCPPRSSPLDASISTSTTLSQPDSSLSAASLVGTTLSGHADALARRAASEQRCGLSRAHQSTAKLLLCCAVVGVRRSALRSSIAKSAKSRPAWIASWRELPRTVTAGRRREAPLLRSSRPPTACGALHQLFPPFGAGCPA